VSRTYSSMPSAKLPFDVSDVTIVSYKVIDIRFPTSLDGVGSDAMHVGTNGSHPYIQLHTNQGGLIGEGIVRIAIPIRLLHY
jgi:L-galactonate dehydratase